MSGKLFYNGVPTGPEVAKLMALNVRPGDRVEYGRVEELIGVARNRFRFETITNAWRKKLFRECHFRLKREGGAFIVLTADQAVSAVAEDLHSLGRKAGRTVVHNEAIDTGALSAQKLAQHTLQRRYTMAVLTAAREACRGIAPPRAVVGLPLRRPPNDD